MSGLDRLARRMLKEAQSLKVPVLPDASPPPLTALEFARAAGVSPDPWQEAVLTSSTDKILLTCSRQSGKSEVAALLAAHQAVTVPGSLSLLIAPSNKQSAELGQRCLSIVKRVEVPGGPTVEAESMTRFTLSNRSRVVALPGSENTVRGYAAARLVVIDEAARVPDEVMVAIRPTRATVKGRLVALSTPAGKRGWFYLEFAGGEGWHKTLVTAAECPRIDPKFLEDERRSMSPHQFAEEYECLFIDSATSAFSSALIEEMMSDDVAPLWVA